MKKLNEEERCELLKDYPTLQYTAKQLSIKYNVSNSFVCKFLKRNGIKNVRYNTNKLVRKYSLNDNYFDVIDTEEKAYFLGLLYADGCNLFDKNNNVTTISLQEKDVKILERFNYEIKSDRPLEFMYKNNDNHQNQYRLTMCSEQISTNLSLLGCTPRKSLTLKFPTEEQVPNHLIQHFIRGYFDGDGCICFNVNFFLLQF